MARDIEEFLRKAAERRKQQGGGAPQKQPPQNRPAPTPPPQRRQPPLRRPAPEPMVIEAELIEPIQSILPSPHPPVNLRNQTVADHVDSHIDTSDIAEHAENLGERIATVHDRTDARISQRLDRDLTEIDDTPTVTDDPSPAIFGARNANAAAELHRMLQNPKTVGQAILVAEILKRPEI